MLETLLINLEVTVLLASSGTLLVLPTNAAFFHTTLGTDTTALLLQTCLNHLKFRAFIFSMAFATLSFKYPVAGKATTVTDYYSSYSAGHVTPEIQQQIFFK